MGHSDLCFVEKTSCVTGHMAFCPCRPLADMQCNVGICHGSNYFVENSPSVMGHGHLCRTEPFCQMHPTCHSVTAVSN